MVGNRKGNQPRSSTGGEVIPGLLKSESARIYPQTGYPRKESCCPNLSAVSFMERTTW